MIPRKQHPRAVVRVTFTQGEFQESWTELFTGKDAVEQAIARAVVIDEIDHPEFTYEASWEQIA